MDAFVHTVFFNGKRVTCDVGNMPMQIRRIFAHIGRLRAAATVVQH